MTRRAGCAYTVFMKYRAVLLAEYLMASGIPLCPACQEHDSRRAAVLIERPEYKDLSVEQILLGCGLCDAHGFLVPAKNADSKQGKEARRRRTKHSLVEFSFALGLPGRSRETMHLFTRIGDSKEEGQMLMKMPARSGDYALPVRCKSVGIGVDIDKWRVAVANEEQRRVRHRAILSTLRDMLLSPDGAMTATMLPHLTGLEGVIVVRKDVGRALMYSALKEDYIARLVAMSATPLGWLAAEYHFPSTYSCRLPLSSLSSALVSPAPGPATVRLALLRVGLEFFSREVVRDSLFPWIRAASVLIRPPERVALCGQVLRAYKADENEGHVSRGESVIYREMAHAEGIMTVYLEIPSSLSCILSEFCDSRITWQEVVPFDGSPARASRNPLKLEVYMWPLQVVRQSGRNTLLIRSPFL